MNAYDIEIVNDAAHAGEANHGWCFGLPPGIRPEQWPLDPDTGYPLMHGFTLLLPEDYRVHGPEIVALSFFSLAPDQNDGGPTSVDGIREMLIDPPAQPPAEAELRPFWEAGRNSHPRLHRMEDILGGAYALILLDAAEFSGVEQDQRIGAAEDVLHPMQTRMAIAPGLPERPQFRFGRRLRGRIDEHLANAVDAGRSTVVLVRGEGEEAQRDDLRAMHPVVLRQQQGEAVHQRIAGVRIQRPLLRTDARRQAEAPAVVGFAGVRGVVDDFDVVGVHGHSLVGFSCSRPRRPGVAV